MQSWCLREDMRRDQDNCQVVLCRQAGIIGVVGLIGFWLLNKVSHIAACIWQSAIDIKSVTGHCSGSSGGFELMYTSSADGHPDRAAPAMSMRVL